jgi:kynurenine formamidase
VNRSTTADAAALLVALVAGVQGGGIEVVDLTHTLAPDFPVMVLPPELGQCQPFRMEEVSRYDARGPGWYWNNISMSEHAGTHFDAPAHWISGRNLPDATVDSLPVAHMVGPAVVLDYSAESAADADFTLTRAHLERWEEENGPIAPRSWVLFRTDWSKHLGTDTYLNLREDGAHSPGPDLGAVEFLVKERDIVGFGTETVGTDGGQGSHESPPYPAHYTLHGNGRYGLQCLNGLDRLPVRGAVLLAAPLKIRHGSGSPLRVLALVPGGGVRS